MNTLPDYLREGLRVVSIGLNPSPNSVQAGYYFATPQNRFWRALNASALVDEPLVPGVAAIERLFETYAIGFTDVVKRPTPGIAQLRAADYRQWAPVLAGKLERFQPAVAWFQGKTGYAHFLRHSGLGHAKTSAIDWGAQGLRIGATRVFVTPNTSPANAVFSLEDLTGWFRALKTYADEGLT